MFLSSPSVDSIFSSENWFSPSAVVLGHPGIQLGDRVIQELPFFDQGVNLRSPFIRNALDLVIPGLESCNLNIGLLVGCHLKRCSVGCIQQLQMSQAVVVKDSRLGKQSL